MSSSLDAGGARLAAGAEFVVASTHAHVVTDVALLVGELAQQAVEPDRAHPPWTLGVLADRAHRSQMNLKERQIPAIADRDGLLAGVGLVSHGEATERTDPQDRLRVRPQLR
jgi:hypothetical protein